MCKGPIHIVENDVCIKFVYYMLYILYFSASIVLLNKKIKKYLNTVYLLIKCIYVNSFENVYFNHIY